jgi:hypothetical protein
MGGWDTPEFLRQLLLDGQGHFGHLRAGGQIRKITVVVVLEGQAESGVGGRQPNELLHLTGPLFGFPRFNVSPAAPTGERGVRRTHEWSSRFSDYVGWAGAEKQEQIGQQENQAQFLEE